MNIFDIIGPVMIGPSSSHTAGAARLGYFIGRLLGEPVRKAEIILYESFASTGEGHGTDKAVVGGLMGLKPDDLRLPDSFALAGQSGLAYNIVFSDQRRSHPNTAEFNLTGESRSLRVTGISLGGGRIEITQIDGFDVSIQADHHTVVVFNRDRFGAVAQVTQLLADREINIAFMRLSRKGEGLDAVMVIETDSEIPDILLRDIKALDNVNDAIYLKPL